MNKDLYRKLDLEFLKELYDVLRFAGKEIGIGKMPDIECGYGPRNTLNNYLVVSLSYLRQGANEILKASPCSSFENLYRTAIDLELRADQSGFYLQARHICDVVLKGGFIGMYRYLFFTAMRVILTYLEVFIKMEK